MAAIDFPNSPSNGATHTEAGTTWVYATATGTWTVQRDSIPNGAIGNGSITGVKLAPSTTGTITFSNGASSVSMSVRKYADGHVVLAGGFMRAGGLSSDTTYATLPAGWRPTTALNVVAAVNGLSDPPRGPGIVNISTGGVIQLISQAYDGAGGNITPRISVDLSGISFHAA